ncbi:hypothetical protein DFQ04_0072 [Algoriphagus boseongensis]|uniref:OmpL-like beta-barrel porin-2 n=1 Tax=Algoriphagus boseongensis TaxID=1442587 RepID=A0A4R6TA23_9BACT|nr:hypothetical protein [Algoriphagus boseongensis]TDQ18274.1 hypothetical protein DFQ04_0072 [Algoriphagus boseongensis]
MKTIHKFLMVAAFGFAHPFHAAAFQSSDKSEEKVENQRSSSIQFNPFSKDFSDTVTVPFQFSFVPFVGTNGTNSGNVINEVSINFFGGYSAGTTSFEMASLFNINRGEMSGVQLAGLFNQVGGKVDGVQLAGLFNSNLDSVRGVQLAGLTNFTTGSVEGVQISGLANFSPKAVKGVQLAGLLNFSAADLEGSQIAGLVNFTAHEVKGSQVGLLNFAGKVDGFQLGLFNYADSMSGVPVGLMSFVRGGYHTVEFGATDILPFNLALRSGKREFYTFFQAGIRPDLDREVTWSFGYGVGTSPRLGQKLFLNIEVSSEQLNKGNVQAVNLINRFYVGGEWQATKRFAIYAGPTINFRVYETDFEGHPDLFTYSFPTIRNEKFYAENIGSQMWYGFKAGFRFF